MVAQYCNSGVDGVVDATRRYSIMLEEAYCQQCDGNVCALEMFRVYECSWVFENKDDSVAALS